MGHDITIRYSELSASRRRLVDNIRRYSFGYIKGLHIKNSEPVWVPPPKIVSHHKFGDRTRSKPIHTSNDSQVVKQYLQLFEEFDQRKNFTIQHLQFQNDLPIYREAEVPVV